MERLGEINERQKRAQAATRFVRYAQALLKHNGDVNLALGDGAVPNDLRRCIEKSAVNAGDGTTSGWASQLVGRNELNDEWLTLLDRRTLLGSTLTRRADFNTRTLATSAEGSAGWVGEGLGVPLCRLTLADITSLDVKKVAGMMALTKESVQLSTPAALGHINTAMVNTVGRYTDRALLDPALSASTGLRPASLTNGVTPIASTGSTDAAITANVKSLLDAHVNAGADLRDVTIVMHPGSALHISTLLTAGNIRAFPNVGVNGGEMFGVPVVTSMGAYSSGSPSERVVAAINGQAVMVADGGIEITATAQAMIQMDDAPTNKSSATATGTTLVSAWQTETVALKFVRYLNFVALAGAVSWMPVTY